MNMNDTPPKGDRPRSLTELCGLDDAAFEQYLQQKEAFLHRLDDKANARIAEALEKKLAWVA